MDKISKEYVKNNLVNDAEESLKQEKILEYILDQSIGSRKEEYEFMFSLIDNNKFKNSRVVFCDSSITDIIEVYPYKNKIEEKVKVYDERNILFFDLLIKEMDKGLKINKMSLIGQIDIWREIEYYIEDSKEKNYEKPIKDYIKYCKENNITKNTIEEIYKGNNVPNIMKFYDKKVKRRDR